ncbi:MAG: saccharopine dehydrogenase NADP-binding domain-containing protein, partial [Calditrichia bacterium]
MKKVIVLGAGMVGRAMAIDLAKNFKVTVADVNPDNLKLLSENGIVETVLADLSLAEKIRELVAGFDLVVGA